ncbi:MULTISPECIES: hypothetical protein [Weeksella]|uniref:hypothetical protein n=1 Tax=Weeksella TaxID=1013 RepID=UPI0008A2AEAE|nr:MULTISPECIES: hypothetical protein [Weeksella]MDK7375280.1 hypothetical protein [Weeksella virosa]
MKISHLLIVCTTGLSFLSCTEAGKLPQYKVESAVQHAYRYRTMNLQDSLAKYVHNFDDKEFHATQSEFGEVKLYNLDNVTEEGTGKDLTYIATYNVEYSSAEGKEIFQVKSINKLPKIVGYSRDLHTVSTPMDSISIQTADSLR